jgi:hypothetical protein
LLRVFSPHRVGFACEAKKSKKNGPQKAQKFSKILYSHNTKQRAFCPFVCVS